MAQLSSQKVPVKKHDLVNVDNQFIEAFIRDGNMVAFKLLFYIAGLDLDSEDIKSEFFKITINLPDMIKVTNVSERRFKRNLHKMQTTTISIIDEKSESYFSLLPKIVYDLKGKVSITMAKEVYQLVKKSKGNLTIIDSQRIYKLKGKHTTKMLLLLEHISGFDIPRKLYTLEELNLLFDTKYKTYSHFENNVLKNAQKELETNSKLSFTYEDKRDLTLAGKGRPRIVGLYISPVGKRSYQPKLKL
ncbi:MAG TPA: RepB family plasmid replication initiator protein [Lutibacter sp.]|nr:RepB family plasmid replication initiator protein [Lutibacter sp.]